MKKYITKLASMGHEVSTSRNLGVMETSLPRLKRTITERLDNLDDDVGIEAGGDDYGGWSEWEYTRFVVYSSQATRKRNFNMIERFFDEMNGAMYPTNFLASHANELRTVLGRKGFAKLCRRYGTSAQQMLARHAKMLKMEEEKRLYRSKHPRRPRQAS